jgi:malate dehydrogenase (quinone)
MATVLWLLLGAMPTACRAVLPVFGDRLDFGDPMSSGMKNYDVAIVGAGISGTSLLYVLSNYTNINSIVLIEKNREVALVNSHKNSNSQTLHFGDIETNYTLEKAEKVDRAASMVRNFLLKTDLEQQSYSKYNKMVLAVGREETEQLRNRYQQFKQLFPKLKLIDRAEIQASEPNVLKGRDPSEEVNALFTEEGYTIDFQKLSELFLEQSRSHPEKTIDLMMGTKVKKIEKDGDLYRIQTEGEAIAAKVVAVMAGAHSLLIAKSLGYGKDYALLSVAGNFYLAPGVLNGKVYTMQLKKIPFAAIHGDPEVGDRSQTRFGPTAKAILMLERGNYATVGEYFQTAGLSLAAFQSFFKILSDPAIWRYMLKNLVYDLPLIGKALFLQEVRKIVPSIKFNELKLAKGYGGIRPQIVNLKTQTLDLGEAKIIGDRILFNITPSPGASTCLQNAESDTEKIVYFLGQDYTFDRYKFLQDLEIESESERSSIASLPS